MPTVNLIITSFSFWSRYELEKAEAFALLADIKVALGTLPQILMTELIPIPHEVDAAVAILLTFIAKCYSAVVAPSHHFEHLFAVSASGLQISLLIRVSGASSVKHLSLFDAVKHFDTLSYLIILSPNFQNVLFHHLAYHLVLASHESLLFHYFDSTWFESLDGAF